MNHHVLFVDENREHEYRHITHTESVTIAAGQMLHVPLQIVVDYSQTTGLGKLTDDESMEYDLEEGGRQDPNLIKDRGIEFHTKQEGIIRPISLWESPTLSCRSDYHFILTITPSR